METKLIKVTNKNETDNFKIILEEILSISSKINEEQQLIISKLTNLENRILIIEKNIVIKKNSEDNEYYDSLKDIKLENIEINSEDVIKALTYRDYRSIIYIFKLFYKNKINSKYTYPIRIVSARSFDYYANSKWNSDLYGYHSMNTIITNIQNLFIKNNDSDKINIDQFLLNQEFICKLSNEKYKKDIFKNIIEEVRINNI
jgi:hypothetical protein